MLRVLYLELCDIVVGSNNSFGISICSCISRSLYQLDLFNPVLVSLVLSDDSLAPVYPLFYSHCGVAVLLDCSPLGFDLRCV